MSSLVLQQLKSAYESNPGGVETLRDLAEHFGLELEVVQAVLQSVSATYRLRQEELTANVDNSDVNPYHETPAPEISNEVISLIQQSMIQTALSCPDERLRFRAQCRVIDEGRGRLDKKAVTQSNITVINNHFRQLKEERQKRKLTTPVVNAEVLT